MLIALGVSLAVLLWQAPATLVAHLVYEGSGNTLRLGEAKGTVWSGQAVVIRPAKQPGRWLPQMPIEWAFDMFSIIDQMLAWRITSGSAEVATIGMGPKGVVATQVHLRGPVSLFVAPFTTNLARAGWRGDVELRSPKVQCTWEGHCAGRLELEWNNAATDLLPGRQLGNYRLTADGVPGDELRFQVRTEEGTIRVQGAGTWRADNSMSFTGTVKGEPELLQRLPSVAGPWVHPTGQADTWNVSITGSPASSPRN